jgi:hypothetical protein
LMTRVSHRHRGIATALLREAERLAMAHGRWLLGARHRGGGRRGRPVRARRLPAHRVIPNYALKPPWRAERHADLLEAAAGRFVVGWISRRRNPPKNFPAETKTVGDGALLHPASAASRPRQSPGNPPPSGWRRRPARR